MSPFPLLKRRGQKRAWRQLQKLPAMLKLVPRPARARLFRLLRLARYTRRALSGGQFMWQANGGLSLKAHPPPGIYFSTLVTYSIFFQFCANSVSLKCRRDFHIFYISGQQHPAAICRASFYGHTRQQEHRTLFYVRISDIPSVLLPCIQINFRVLQSNHLPPVSFYVEFYTYYSDISPNGNMQGEK